MSTNSECNFYSKKKVKIEDRNMTSRQESQAKRWCFTINNPGDEDKFWENGDNISQIQYIVVQLEKGQRGTQHYQGFLILTKKKRMTWLKNNFNRKAHWEKARGTDKQASDYCKKDDTRVEGGLRFEHGTITKEQETKTAEAEEQLEQLKTAFKRPADIPAEILLQQNFISAYKLLTCDILGPYRPNLKVITMVSPPGCGKSFLINSLFPHAARLIMGNSGFWWQNPCEKVAVIEEFNGQIPLQKMLQLLDPYPQSLEVKGGTRPCLFEVIFITSNSSPEEWYRTTDKEVLEKRHQALLALYDRLGYKPLWFTGQMARESGHYLQPVLVGAITRLGSVKRVFSRLNPRPLRQLNKVSISQRNA